MLLRQLLKLVGNKNYNSSPTGGVSCTRTEMTVLRRFRSIFYARNFPVSVVCPLFLSCCKVMYQLASSSVLGVALVFNIFATASIASACWVWKLCKYVVIVVVGEECPKQLWTVFTSTPFDRRALAWKCRKLCRETYLMPVRLQNCLK